MRSHMHELWEELDLSPLYPEPDLDKVMARVLERTGEELPQDNRKRRNPMHKRKLILSLAAALAVLSGSAVAVAGHLGVLDAFFQGDTSALESYVQTQVGSTENQDYRFTVDSAYYDGISVYAVVTVEGLNDQAVADLKSNKVIADCHRDFWGDEMADDLLKRGSAGPDGFLSNAREVAQERGGQDTGSGTGANELPAPSDTSRSWKIDVSFQEWMGPLEDSLLLWPAFMGRDYGVEIPLDQVTHAIRLTPDQEVLLNPISGQRAVVKEIAFTPTQLSFQVEMPEPVETDSAFVTSANWWFALGLKDGSVVTSSQLGWPGNSIYDPETGLYESSGEFNSILIPNVEDVVSILIGDMAFPANASAPTPVDPEEHLRPFAVSVPSGRDLAEGRKDLISLRLMCEGLGAVYTWDQESQTATAVFRGVTVQIPVGSSTIYVDGEPVELTYDPIEWDGPNDDTRIPNPAQPSPLEEDVLVQASPFREIWGIECSSNYTYDDYDLGAIIYP